LTMMGALELTAPRLAKLNARRLAAKTVPNNPRPTRMTLPAFRVIDALWMITFRQGLGVRFF
jgi:hypothetical protein